MGLPFDGRLLPHSLFSRFSAFPPQAPIPFPFRLLRTLLQSSKSQLFCFQAIPQSLCNTPGVGGVHESVWQLQVVATNCARPTTLSQYVVVATNKNRVPTQTRTPRADAYDPRSASKRRVCRI